MRGPDFQKIGGDLNGDMTSQRHPPRPTYSEAGAVVPSPPMPFKARFGAVWRAFEAATMPDKGRSFVTLKRASKKVL
jgi:hypothetical protein